MTVKRSGNFKYGHFLKIHQTRFLFIPGPESNFSTEPLGGLQLLPLTGLQWQKTSCQRQRCAQAALLTE